MSGASGLDPGAFAGDIDALGSDFRRTQSEMFLATMRANNEAQQDNLEDEYQFKMNRAAWKTGSSAATVRVQ